MAIDPFAEAKAYTKRAMAARKRARAHMAKGEVRYSWGAQGNANELSKKASVARERVRKGMK